MDLFDTITDQQEDTTATTETQETPATATPENKEIKTRIYKGRDGWEAVTHTADNGEGYKITTYKGHRGGIVCNAQKGTFSDGNFSYIMFSDKSTELAKSDSRATENTIRELHQKGLEQFLTDFADLPAPYVMPIGQKLTCYGYAMNESGNWVVFEIIDGRRVKAVDVDSLEIHTFDHVRDIDEKFGIGTYYTKGNIFDDLEALELMVIEATEKQAQKEKAESEAKEIEKAETLQKIEDGKNIVSIPAGAVGVIVADFMQDDSDIQSDYFASHSTKRIYLAFTSHKRDLFAEMRKACLNCDIEEIRAFADVPEFDSERQEHPEDEHREKYSMGAGFYLMARGDRNGWRISKDCYQTIEQPNALYIAGAEGRFFANAEMEPEKTNFEPVPVEAGNVSIVDYSEKSFAVIGDTKPIKDQLKELGGKFNFRLTCGAGWIFPKSKLEEVQALFN
jgi:hypothetical protein